MPSLVPCPVYEPRLVESLTLHREPIDFRELCLRAVRPTTRYVVFDLDRTIHAGRNMGELLGWEIGAYLAYGPEHLARIEPTRGSGRFCLSRERPLESARYLLDGVEQWGGPGLFYLLWGKLAAHVSPLRRHSYLRFGPDPVPVVQRVPQLALMQQLARLPLAVTRELAARVFHRYQDEAICDASDIAWLRQRCPGVTVLISSASPRPMLEAAAEALKVDGVIYSTAEERDGYLGGPYELARVATLHRAPHHLSRPSETRINSGTAKLEQLALRFPELLERGVESVGITDTGYGEDHAWPSLFSTVIDVNSNTPFSPLVPRAAPVESIHSASLLTRAERRRRTLDRVHTRGAKAGVKLFARAELEAYLGGSLRRAKELARVYGQRALLLSPRREPILADIAATNQLIEDAVTRFNAAQDATRTAAWRELRTPLQTRRRLVHQLAQVERPLAELAFRYRNVLERARAQLDQHAPSARDGLVTAPDDARATV